MVEVFCNRLKKEGLLSIPEDERNAFIAFGHLNNEICLFNRLVLWAYTTKTAEEEDAEQNGSAEAIHVAQLSQTLILLRILAGKLKEGWELLRKSYFPISQAYEDDLPKGSKNSLIKIKRYFNRKSILKELRNSFAFHYSPSEIGKALETLPEGETLDVYIGSLATNTLFYGAEVLASNAMINAIDPQDSEKAFELIVKDIIDITHQFLNFSQGFILVFQNRYGSRLVEVSPDRIEIRNAPDFDKVEIPWFTVVGKEDSH